MIGFCRHEKYVTQYRAIFVINCKIDSDQVLKQNGPKPIKGKSRREASSVGGETLKKVSCSACSTEVGVVDEDEVYHFFNALPSES